MLYNTTTYYNLQALQRNTTRRAWASPVGGASGSKFGPVLAVEAFSGVSGTYPCPRPVSGLLGVPARPGCDSWACLVGNGDAGQLGRLVAGLPLGVQPCGLPARAGVRVERRRSACLLFPAKPLLTAFQRARCWMWAQVVELAPARRAAPGRCLAAGQPFDRPTRSGGAKGAKRPEGRRARRALRRFGSRCRSVFPQILPANYR